MAIYKYRAKNGPTDILEGTIEAQSRSEAIEKVSRMGYLPMFMEECKSAVESKVEVLHKPLGKVKSRDITIFSRQLASLLKSGVPILASLNIISEQSESPNLKSALRNIHNLVKEGATFSSALSQYPNMFSSLYIAMIQAGESSGVLPEVLLRIADHNTKQEELFSRFRMALAYPILMAIVGLGTIVFMLTFVIPRLMAIFINMGQSLPLPTRIVISVSQGLRQWWIWVVLLLFILIMKRQARAESAKLYLSRIKLKLPIFGKLTLKLEVSRFCRTLELLIKSGIPILRALDVSIPVVNNEIIKQLLRQSYKRLEQGGSFGKSLKDLKLFPLFMSNLIIVGEESGKLNESLAEVSSTYERETDELMKIMTNLLEPMMILVMGLIVGFMVVAMLLPVFEINLMVR
jgi:type II secretory pathway component PulF